MGGSQGTTTTTQTNTPFNAAQLLDYQNKAVGLSNSNPIDYYSGQTYAPPPDLNNDSLSAANFWGNASGNNTAGAAMINQENAINGNNFIAAGSGVNTLNPWLDSLSQYGNSNIGATGNGATILNDIAGGGWLYPQSDNINSLANAASGPGTDALRYAADGNYMSAADPYLSGLSSAATTGPGAGALSQIAGGQYLQGASPYLSGLTNATNTGPGSDILRIMGGGGSLADRSLGATASGAFLGANPYLNAQFNAAADPVITNFMRAVSPQTDSAMNAAGRFNSGALSSTQAQNQDSLGKSLGDLGATLYGNDYQNERGLMTNAAGTLGNLENTAGSDLLSGNINALGSALSGYNTGVGQINSAAANLLSGNITGLTNRLAAQNNLASLATTAANNLANINLTGRADALNAYTNLTGQATTAAGNLANSEVSGRNSELSALQTAMSGYNTGLGLQQNAINSTPALSALPFSDFTASTAAGTQLQQNEQAAIQDAENRFYGNELSPWSTVQQEAGLIGGAIPGVTTTQQPYYTNPIGQAAGGIGAVASLGKLLK